MVGRRPGKQRLARFLAPPHARRRFLSAPLSRGLREKHGRRSLPVRKGDRVRIMRGDFKKLEGEVSRVDPKRGVVFIEGASTTKVDGTQVQRPIHPSNLVILSLVEDKERSKVLGRGAKGG